MSRITRTMEAGTVVRLVVTEELLFAVGEFLFKHCAPLECERPAGNIVEQAMGKVDWSRQKAAELLETLRAWDRPLESVDVDLQEAFRGLVRGLPPAATESEGGR